MSLDHSLMPSRALAVLNGVTLPKLVLNVTVHVATNQLEHRPWRFLRSLDLHYIVHGNEVYCDVRQLLDTL